MSFPEAEVKKKKNPALTSLLPLDNSFLGVRSLGCESFATEPIWFLRPHVCHQGVLRDIMTMHIHDTSAEEREGLLPHSHANTGRGGVSLFLFKQLSLSSTHLGEPFQFARAPHNVSCLYLITVF